MPRTTSLIAAVAAAFAVAVPTAAAEGQPAGIYRAGVYSAPQSGTTQMLDARERAFDAKQVSSAPDWFERFAAAHSLREPVVDDRFRIDPTADSAAASSGREVEWPQIGIGVLLVVALGISGYLVARSRQRPLAH